MIREPKIGEELERLIVEHPVRMCLRMRLGLMEEINENGEDMLDAMKMTFDGLVYLALCILIALRHMAMLIFYPYFHVRKFLILRKRIKTIPDACAAWRRIGRRVKNEKRKHLRF